MKTLMVSILFFSFISIGYSQSNGKFTAIDKSQELKIVERIQMLEGYFKNPKANSIKEYISKNAENHLVEKLVQMQEQLPKGNLSIEKAIRNDDREFKIDVRMKPFGIPFIIVLDSVFSFKSVNINENPSQNEQFGASEFDLGTKHIQLPFHLFDGFILIEGTVNGKKGKFMFDTGMPFGLLLNNNYLKLKKKGAAVKGAAGSGQSLDVYLTDNISVDLGNSVQLSKLNTIAHADLKFLEKGLTSDFLGFIGYDFFKNYEFVIDYDYQVIDLYLTNENGEVVEPYKLNNTEITTLAFTVASDAKQIPIVDFQLDNTTIKGSFDTGNQGHIGITENTKNELLKNVALEMSAANVWYGQYSDETEVYNLKALNYKNVTLFDTKNLSLHETTENSLGLGYQFLKNYISVWNYKKGTITLLSR